MTTEYISLSRQKIATKELLSLAPYFDALSPDEYTRVRDFLQSPFFNTDEQLNILFKALTTAQKKGTTHLNGKTLLAKWGNDKHKQPEKRIKDKVKKLQQLLLDYFAHDHLTQTPIDKSEILLRRFRNRGIPPILKRLQEERQELIDASPTSMHKLLYQYLLDHYTYYDLNVNHQVQGPSLFQQLRTSFERFQQAARSMYELEKRTYQRVFSIHQGVETSVPIKSAVQQWFERFMLVFDETDTFSETAYRSLSQALLAEHEQLDSLLRYILCKYMVNISSELVTKQGKIQYAQDLLFWIQKRVAWMPSFITKMDANEYLNLIITSSRYGDIEYARQFAISQQSKLPAEDAELALQLGLAFCHFNAREYQQTRDILNTHLGPFSTRRYIFTLRSKSLLIRACLAAELTGEQGYDEFLRVKDDFRMYLNRIAEVVPPSYLEAYRSFLSLANQIFLDQRHLPNDHQGARNKRLLSLRQHAADTDVLIAKEWFLQLLDEAIS